MAIIDYLYTDKFPILTVQKGCDKLCDAFPGREGDADKNVCTLRGGGVVKSVRERTRGGGG